MNHAFVISVLALLLQLYTTARAQTAQDASTAKVTAIIAQFEAAYDREVAKPNAAAIAALDEKYLAAVKRALDAASQAGNLEEALKLREETARITASQPLPSVDAETLPAALKGLRSTYRAALARFEADRAAKSAPLLAKLDLDLEALQKTLTQQQQIDAALLVQAKRDDLRAQYAKGPPPPGAGAAPVASTDWLGLARRRGGVLKLWGGPEPGKDIELPAKAARFDDYVSLNVTSTLKRVLFATRKDGSVVILDFTDLPKIAVLEPRNASQINTGDMHSYLGKDGKVYSADGTELLDSRVIKKPAGFAHGYRGGVVYSAEGELEAFRVSKDLQAPPADFIKGRRIVSVGATDTIVFLTDQGGVIGWDARAKQPVTFDRLKESRVVELAVGSGFVFRTADGQVLCSDAQGRFGNGGLAFLGTAALKDQSGPFVRVQATGAFGAVQRQDGSWLAWAESASLVDKVHSLGPVLDVDAAHKAANGDNPASSLVAWIEFPAGTVPAK